MGTFLYAAPLDALLARSLAPSPSTTYGSGSKMRVSVSFRRIPLPPSFPSPPLRGVQIFLCHCHSSANHPQLIIVFVIFLASSVDDGEFSSSSHKTKSSLQHYLNALLLAACRLLPYSTLAATFSFEDDDYNVANYYFIKMKVRFILHMEQQQQPVSSRSRRFRLIESHTYSGQSFPSACGFNFRAKPESAFRRR